MNNSSLDRISGAVFVIIGVLVVVGAWAMPRFEKQGSAIYETPGLTPGLLGCALSLCGLILMFRPAGAEAENYIFWNKIAGSSANRIRAIAALGLTLVYGAVLFGSVPYVIATSLFVFAFIVVFEWWQRPQGEATSRHSVWRVLMVAALIALIVSITTQYIFQTLFLVRLP